MLADGQIEMVPDMLADGRIEDEFIKGGRMDDEMMGLTDPDIAVPGMTILLELEPKDETIPIDEPLPMREEDAAALDDGPGSEDERPTTLDEGRSVIDDELIAAEGCGKIEEEPIGSENDAPGSEEEISGIDVKLGSTDEMPGSNEEALPRMEEDPIITDEEPPAEDDEPAKDEGPPKDEGPAKDEKLANDDEEPTR